MPKHAAPAPVWHRLAVLGITTMLLSSLVAVWVGHSTARSAPRSTSASAVATKTSAPSAPVNAGSNRVNGLLTFRGNATRTSYGQGPVPEHPSILWSYPDQSMCSQSHDLSGFAEWCGTGWTGEPAVWERDGRTLVAFGAYDRALHVSQRRRAVPRARGHDLLR